MNSNATDPIALLVNNICHLNNGGIEQVGQFLAAQHASVGSRFIERCSSMIGAVAERSATDPSGAASSFPSGDVRAVSGLRAAVVDAPTPAATAPSLASVPWHQDMRRLTGLWRFGAAVLPTASVDFCGWLCQLDGLIDAKAPNMLVADARDGDSEGKAPAPPLPRAAVDALGTAAKDYGVAMQQTPGFTAPQRAMFLDARERLLDAIRAYGEACVQISGSRVAETTP